MKVLRKPHFPAWSRTKYKLIDIQILHRRGYGRADHNQSCRTFRSEMVKLKEIESPLEAAVVWFRNDLRLADHGPLRQACASGSQYLVPVYFVNPDGFAPRILPGGECLHIPRLGPFRLRCEVILCQGCWEERGWGGVSANGWSTRYQGIVSLCEHNMVLEVARTIQGLKLRIILQILYSTSQSKCRVSWLTKPVDLLCLYDAHSGCRCCRSMSHLGSKAGMLTLGLIMMTQAYGQEPVLNTSMTRTHDKLF
jgi:hypothetical protein